VGKSETLVSLPLGTTVPSTATKSKAVNCGKYSLDRGQI
jgi:hypothetical protein